METFSLLKHWKGGGAASIAFRSAKPRAVTTISSILQSNDDDHEGPFFDFEFSLSQCSGRKGMERRDSDYSVEEEREFNVPLSPSRTSIEQVDTDLLLAEEGLLQLNPTDNPLKLHIPLTLYKTATKFRVLMLRFRKAKSEDMGEDQNLERNTHGKTFSIDLKEQEVPIFSLFTRDYSNSKSRIRKLLHVNDDDKHLIKEIVQKYLKLINSLHVKSSKACEELGFSGPLGLGTGKGNKKPTMQPKDSANMCQKQMSFSGFRVVHWRKSRSSSASVSAMIPSTMQIPRRDDSLFQDGIQSAIAHCKKSFNASNGHQDWIKE